MRSTSVFAGAIVRACFLALPVGVVLVLAERTLGVSILGGLGGWLMAPALAGMCLMLLAVVALSPAFPVAAALDRVPPRAHGPILAVGIVCTVLWWLALGWAIYGLLAF